MLIALLTAFLLGGSGGVGGAILTPAGVKQIVKEVVWVVPEEAKVDQAKATLAELKKEIQSFEKDFGRSGNKLAKLFKDHDAEPEAMLEVLDELNASWAESQKRAVEIRFELRDALNERQWNEIFGGE